MLDDSEFESYVLLQIITVMLGDFELELCVLLQIIKVMLDDSEFESFVFCLAQKRISSVLLKDHQDLVCWHFCLYC